MTQDTLPLLQARCVRTIRRITAIVPALVLLFCLAGAALSQPDGAPRNDPARVRADLNRVMADPEFQPDHVRETLFSRVVKWIGDQWDRFVKWLRHLFGMDRERTRALGGSGYGLQWVFIYLFIVGGILLIAWLLVTYLRNRQAASKATPDMRKIYDLDNADADSVTEPDDWLHHARAFAAQNDFRRAFRAVFLAILLQMDRANAIEYHRARTNGDYLRLLISRNLSALASSFRPFVLEFEQRWYGERKTDLSDYQRALDAYDRMQRQLKEHALPEESLPAPTPSGGS